jgi:hypothetical protein
MKVMVIIKATKETEAGVLPDERLLTEMGQYNEKLVSAGMMLAGEGLHASSQGVRINFSDKAPVVTDGPFAETRELIAGFWLWRVESMDEAIAWAKRCPNPKAAEFEIEIRRVFDPEDFGPSATPELKEKEQRLRAQAASNFAGPSR